MSNAILGYGAKLQRNGGAGLADIAEVLKFGGPTMKVGQVDVTHLQSPDAWAEFIAGVADGGLVTAEVNFLPTDNTQNLNGLLKDIYTQPRPVRGYAILFPPTASPTTWSFNAFIVDWSVLEVSPTGQLKAQIAFKVTGKPTLA